MSTSADHAAERGLAERLGIEPGMVVQVVGGDGDADTALQDGLAARTGPAVLTPGHPHTETGERAWMDGGEACGGAGK